LEEVARARPLAVLRVLLGLHQALSVEPHLPQREEVAVVLNLTVRLAALAVGPAEQFSLPVLGLLNKERMAEGLFKELGMAVAEVVAQTPLGRLL
jgi:hypothetical protein